jgi:ABC-type antimicrobial peptide transport system permease subunit
VVVVNQAFSDRYYPGRDPLGQQLRSGVSFGYELEEDQAFTIVGVVGNTRAYGLERDPSPELYLTQAQAGSDFLTLVIEVLAGMDVLRAIEKEVHAVDPNLPLRRVETLAQRVERKLGPSRFYMLLLVTFAVLAVVLAAIGLYGVVSYIVSQRRKEFAVRIAIGADAARVRRLVVGDSCAPVVGGLAVGLAAALVASRFLEAMLYGIDPSDPVAYAAAILLLATVAFAAILRPAFHASRISPMSLLRDD